MSDNWLDVEKYRPQTDTPYMVTIVDQDWVDVVIAEFEDGNWYSRFNGEKITQTVVAFWSGAVPDAYYPEAPYG